MLEYEDLLEWQRILLGGDPDPEPEATPETTGALPPLLQDDCIELGAIPAGTEITGDLLSERLRRVFAAPKRTLHVAPLPNPQRRIFAHLLADDDE